MPNCRYYAHSGIGGTLFPTGGNQCGMITDSHSPCQMEMAGQEPDWETCPLNLLQTIHTELQGVFTKLGRRHLGLYILGGEDGHTAIPMDDPIQWAMHHEDLEARTVKQERVGEFWISTVFLGVDHGFCRFFEIEGHPILFETMVFTPEGSLCREQCSTWAEAEEQHKTMVKKFRRVLNG